jgi:hypothetical protein
MNWNELVLLKIAHRTLESTHHEIKAFAVADLLDSKAMTNIEEHFVAVDHDDTVLAENYQNDIEDL